MTDVPQHPRIDAIRSEIVSKRKATGAQITSIMRLSRVTIRELANRTGFTMKRIREVREAGLRNLPTVRDWLQAITGTDPGPL